MYPLSFPLPHSVGCFQAEASTHSKSVEESRSHNPGKPDGCSESKPRTHRGACEACPLLDAAANPQRWPGDSESPDWTLQYRMIFVSAPRPRLVQRTATTTTTLCHTPRQALDTTPPVQWSGSRRGVDRLQRRAKPNSGAERHYKYNALVWRPRDFAYS